MKLRYFLGVKPGSTTKYKTNGWRTKKPVVDHEVCIGCGKCDLICPEGVCFSTGQKNSKGKVFYERDLDYCKGCGLCAKTCPVKAIKMMPDVK